MFDTLSNRLTSIFDKLKRHGKLSEADVTSALREVRIALLEADVALPVVKSFIEEVKHEAIGQEVLQSIHPSQMVIKIVHDHLVRLLSSDTNELNLAGSPPVVILMVGLQGSGKTTTTAKLANILSHKNNKKVLMASLDIYRPAAQHQLDVLGKSIQVATVPIIPNESPLQITERALKISKTEGYDILLLDTAGRLHIDSVLMDEISEIKAKAKPLETLLVADAMTGQDAAHVAKTFQEKIGLTGLILTRIDGDARGGAALSMRSVAGVPIKFLGMGEKIDQIDVFHPDRLANRILGMGDVVSLVEKAMETIDQEEAENLAKKMQKGSFDLNDMALQLKQISKMGGMSGVMNLLPGIGKIKDKIQTAGLDDGFLKQQLAIISSMTPREKGDPRILNASRKRRISSGSGTTLQEINKLLKQHRDMETMMKRMGKLGKKGFLRQGIGSLFSR